MPYNKCVGEKTFTAKRILACSATEMTVSKEENALPKTVAVAISPEPKAAPMPINEIFNIEVKFDSPCSPESKASYEDFRTQIEDDSKDDNITIAYPWDKEEHT